MIYLDNNATAAPYDEVLAFTRDILKNPSNSSSIHSFGRNAKYIIETARTQIKNSLKLDSHSKIYQIIFTSSGTEANNLILSNFCDAEVLVCATEHLSILMQESKISNFQTIEVDGDGLIKLDKLEFLLKTSKANKKLVSVMLANNETGVIQPLQEVKKLAHRYNALIHSDLVQAVGKMPVNLPELDLDFATISSHKFGGIVGAAALIAKTQYNLLPMIIGGGQERGLRAGTENVAAIAGFGLASVISAEKLDDRISWTKNLQTKLENELCKRFSKLIVFGEKTPRLSNTSLIALPNTSSSLQLIGLDLRGIAVSSGAACSSGKVSKSHVLESMQVEENIAASAIRISTSYKTSEHEIDCFINAFQEINAKYD